jgi:hypothetical protein
MNYDDGKSKGKGKGGKGKGMVALVRVTTDDNHNDDDGKGKGVSVQYNCDFAVNSLDTMFFFTFWLQYAAKLCILIDREAFLNVKLSFIQP